MHLTLSSRIGRDAAPEIRSGSEVPILLIFSQAHDLKFSERKIMSRAVPASEQEHGVRYAVSLVQKN
jgi:hypothetical protein